MAEKSKKCIFGIFGIFGFLGCSGFWAFALDRPFWAFLGCSGFGPGRVLAKIAKMAKISVLQGDALLGQGKMHFLSFGVRIWVDFLAGFGSGFGVNFGALL